MDVRNVKEITPEVEHNGTVPVWWLIKPQEMKGLTDGGYLELANEFEVAVHRDVAPGDLVYIPPDAVHSLRPTGDGPIHCFCFAVGVKDAGPINYTTH